MTSGEEQRLKELVEAVIQSDTAAGHHVGQLRAIAQKHVQNALHSSSPISLAQVLSQVITDATGQE